jgi:peptidoglycan L-alanyl-D-glutamate endopeptidase CwlK
MSHPSSRKLGDLDPRLASIFYRFDVAMKLAGIDFIVTCTYRNNEDQNAAYASGRTAKGPIITNAKAGESMHNVTDSDGTPKSRAFDIVIMKSGKIDYDKKNPNWKRAGTIGKSVGLEWAGDWVSFNEYPHFQLPKETK